MNSNGINVDWHLWSALLVDIYLLDFGQSSNSVVPNNLSKHSVETIEVRRLVEGNKELGAVGARTLIGHGNDAALAMAQGWTNLVLEGASPDRLAAFGVVGGGIRGTACLDHKLGDKAVKGRLVVVARGAKG